MSNTFLTVSQDKLKNILRGWIFPFSMPQGIEENSDTGNWSQFFQDLLTIVPYPSCIIACIWYIRDEM